MNGTRQIALYLRRYLPGMGPRLIACLLLGMLQSAGLVPMAWLIRRAFDQVIPSHNVRLLVFTAGVILGATLLTSTLSLLTRVISFRITKEMVAGIRRDLIQRIYSLPRSFHDTADRGALNSLIVQDTQQVDTMIGALIPAATAALQGFVVLIVLAVMDAKLLSVVLIASPAMRLLSRRIGVRVRRSAVAQREAFAEFFGGVQAGLQNMDLTHSQSAAPLEMERHQGRIEKVRATQQHQGWLQGVYGMAQGIVVGITGLLIMVAGGMQVAAGGLSTGTLLSFYAGTLLLTSCASQVMSAVPGLLAGLESVQALYSFNELQTRNPYCGTARVELRHQLKIQAISFSYGSKKILDRLSLELRRGTLTVLVGANGGGKTSLARLILGLYRPSEGELSLDGVPFEAIDLEHFRKSAAFSAQDPQLFAGTIGENIRYGLDAGCDEKVEQACKIALVHDFVELLPDRYNTRVGEGGAALSGGQRQKIAIARALARLPRLLILDEPTNHLDPESAEKLMRNLARLPGNPAVLIITQDAAIPPYATACYRLQQGRLTEETSALARPFAELEGVPA